MGVALAQDVTGTITARMDGAERTWNTLGFELPDGYESSATWSVVMDPMVAISIQGVPGTGFQVEETLSLELTSFDGFPTDCPCRLPQAEVHLTAVEPLANDAFRVEGTFAATLTLLVPVSSWRAMRGRAHGPWRSKALQATGDAVAWSAACVVRRQ